MSDGGPAIPVVPVTDRPVSAAPALRVAVVSDGRPSEGGPTRPVYVVTDNRPTQGNTPMPVVLATGAQAGHVMAGPAIPVVVVSGSLNPTPPFNPATDIFDIQWWHEADTLVLADNDPVTLWLDSTANGYDASLGTGTAPTYKQNTLNGKPVVRFNGLNTRLRTAMINHNIGAGDLFYVALVQTGASLTGYRCMTANNAFAPGFYVTSGAVNLYFLGNHITVNVLSPSTWYTLIVRRISGDLFFTINGVLDPATLSMNTPVVNSISTIGDESTGVDTPWNGDIAAVGFGKTLNDTDLASLTSYLRTKYAHY